jgi:hypothetical protein
VAREVMNFLETVRGIEDQDFYIQQNNEKREIDQS